MVKIPKAYGLQPIDDVGKKFDPQLHEVVCQDLS
jgi:molecular chaperone GrpE (heat shock protein)